jgi:hypothetical protein
MAAPSWTADVFAPATGGAVDQHPRLGRVHRTADGSEFIWLFGVTSLAVGDAVVYNPSTGAVTRLVAAKNGPVAVAMAANTASTSYSWYQIKGVASVNILDDMDLDDPLYVTGTAGAVDDTGSAGGFVFDMMPLAAITGGPKLGSVYIDHPWTTHSGYLT